jgi:hypothetical protein
MEFASPIAQFFRMSDEIWARHANPWSVWTRVPLLFLLLAVVWSHTSLKGWVFLPLGLLCAWIWLNPRVFSRPTDTDNWASKATFGERVFLARHARPIPARHERMAHLLSGVAAVGTIVALGGALFNDLLLTVAGGSVAWFGKMWFCDRMVWLYADMKDRHPDYASWLRRRGTNGN